MERGNPPGTSDTFANTGDAGPIEKVHKGMHVVDAAGDDIGRVEFVKMGDPQAATIGADADTRDGLAENFAEIFGWDGEPDLPPALAARLMRVGFIKIDSKGLFAKDRYVAADRIAGVSGDTVRLTVNKDDMAEES
ncbi:MAG TPA: hypothetical protein VFI12_04610 [Thermomicrobiales bacterium]|jgi:hypothetical protein|nr:hypothetical protein [Thermomicrobiales bacterium]